MVPPLLFPGIPGGPELLIILLIVALPLLVLPLLAVAVAYVFGKRRGRAEATTHSNGSAEE